MAKLCMTTVGYSSDVTALDKRVIYREAVNSVALLCILDVFIE